MGCLSYVIGCPRAKAMAVVDPKRDVQDYLTIARAEHFPLSDILSNRLPEAEKDEELVLQCGSGYRSNIGASILRQAGYTNVKSLAGGVFAWSNAGLALI